MLEAKEETKREITVPSGIEKLIKDIFKNKVSPTLDELRSQLHSKFQIKRNGGMHSLHTRFLEELKTIDENSNITQEEIFELFTNDPKNKWYTDYIESKISAYNPVIDNYTQLVTKIDFWHKKDFFLHGSFLTGELPEVRNFSAAMQAFELSRPGFINDFSKTFNGNGEEKRKLTIKNALDFFSHEFVKIQKNYTKLLDSTQKVAITEVLKSEKLSAHENEAAIHKYFKKLCVYHEERFTKKNSDKEKPIEDLSGFLAEKEERIKSDLDYHARCWVLLKQNFGEELKKLKKALVQLQEEEGQALTFKRKKEVAEIKEKDPIWYEELQEDNVIALPDAIKVKKRQEKNRDLKNSKKMAAFNGFSSASMAVFGFIALFGGMISTPYLILLSVLLFIPSFFAYYKFTQHDIFSVLKLNHFRLEGTTFPQKAIICLLAGSVIFVVTAHSFVGMYVFLAHFIAATWILSFASLVFAIPAGIFIGIFMLRFTYSLVVNWESHLSDFLNFVENLYWGPLKIALKSDSWSERLGIFPHLIFNLIKHSFGVVIFIIAALLTFENLSPMTTKFIGWFFKPSSSLLPPNMNYIKTIATSITAINVGYWTTFSMAKVRGLTDQITLRSTLAAVFKFPLFAFDLPLMLLRIMFSFVLGKPKAFIFSNTYQKIDSFCEKHIRGKTYSNTDRTLLDHVIKNLAQGDSLSSPSDSSTQILRKLTPMQESAALRKVLLDTTKDASFGLAAGDNALSLAVAGFNTATLGGLPPEFAMLFAVLSVFFARWGVKVTPKAKEEEASLYATLSPTPVSL